MNVGVVINVSIPGDVVTTRHLYLKLVLDELAKQLRAGDRIVVVCDACGEAVTRVGEEFHCRLVAERATFGFDLFVREDDVHERAPDGRPWRLASSRNFGVSVMPARIDVFAFLDADCVPAPTWRWQIEDAMQSCAGNAVLFGRTDHEGPLGNQDIRLDPRLEYSRGRAIESRGRNSRVELYRMAALFERGGGGNMAIDRIALGVLNGFDADFDGGFGYEETELACRAFNRGVGVFFVSSMHVLHKFHPREADHFHNLDRNRRLFMSKTGLSAFSREA